MDRLRTLTLPIVFVLLVAHDVKHKIIMVVLIKSMFAYPHSNNTRLLVLVLAVANQNLCQVSMTNMVVVQ